MKILKRILQLLFALIALVLVTFSAFWITDTFRTSYLNAGHMLESGKSFLIANMHVIPMNEDTVLQDHMVFIENGIIKQIGKKIVVEDIPFIDAEGKYLLPGLIDMHVHVWDKYELGLYLANGVTAARNLLGLPMHLRLKEEINNGEIISPAFFTTGPKLTGQTFSGDDNLNLSSTAEVREKVREYKELGYDFIKTYCGLEKNSFDAILKQATISQIDIVAHSSQKVPFSYHLNPRIKPIEHAEEIVQQPLQFDFDTAKLQAIIDTLAHYGNARYCPTLTVFHNIYYKLKTYGLKNRPVFNFGSTIPDALCLFHRINSPLAHESFSYRSHGFYWRKTSFTFS